MSINSSTIHCGLKGRCEGGKSSEALPASSLSLSDSLVRPPINVGRFRRKRLDAIQRNGKKMMSLRKNEMHRNKN